jgi:hypothetical protein
MPFIDITHELERQFITAPESKAVFLKLRGVIFQGARSEIARSVFENNIRLINGYVAKSKTNVENFANKLGDVINKKIESAVPKGRSGDVYIDFNFFYYDESEADVHRLKAYKPDGKLRIGIHYRDDLTTDAITDKYDINEELKIDIPSMEDVNITLSDLPDDLYNSILELNPSFFSKSEGNSILEYGKLAALTAASHSLVLNNQLDELKGRTILFKGLRDYIGDDSENVLLFDFLGYDPITRKDTSDIIKEDLDTAAQILHRCIWLINISERGRPDGGSQYDLHTRLNITLAFTKCNDQPGELFINGVRFPYTVHKDDQISMAIKGTDVDEEGVLQDPPGINKNDVDNPGNVLILNRYLGTIARYKSFDNENGQPNQWFKTYIRLISNMSTSDFYEFASEILRNIMIICSQPELGITLFKMARTRYCAYKYCHTEIDPTFPVNLNIPRVIPIEPLEVETHCNCDGQTGE